MKSDHQRREQRLLALSARRDGVVSLQQFLALGFSASTASERVRTGRLHRLYTAVFAVGRPDVSVRGHRRAAVLACGAGAVLSHVSAAALHGLRSTAAARVDVTVPRRSVISHPGIRVHRSTTLLGRDVTEVDSIPCTSVARTLLDLASVLDARSLEKAIEQAVILETYDARQVDDVLRRARGQPGSRRLANGRRTVLPGETVTASDLEERMLALCRRWGLPPPSVNAWLLLGGDWAKVDFLWREQRVVVETDSYRYHRSRAAFTRDRRRDRLLECEGFRHARFSDQDFDEDVAHIERVLRQLLST